MKIAMSRVLGQKTSIMLGFILGLLITVCALEELFAAETQDLSPLKKVEITIDKIVDIVTKNPGEEMLQARRDKLREVINPVFDFNEMAKRSLGPHWSKVTPEEQKEFVDIFSDLLAKTYLSKIETVKPGMVKVEKEKVDLKKAEVYTTVTNKGDTFPIDYKLQNRDGLWRVYDVEIENIGLVANYRNEFAGIIRKEEFSGLLTRLRNK